MRHRSVPQSFSSWILAGAASCVLLTPTTVQAQPPGSFALGAERVFAMRRVTVNPDGGDSQSTTSIGLLGTPLAGTVYSGPRVTFDYLTRGGFTIGGGFAYQNLNGEGDDDSISGVLFAPRAGYFVMAGQSFGVWPRGGVSYLSTDIGNTDTSYTALTLEVALLPLLASNRFGIVIAPYADIGIAGGTDNTDATATELGVHFGLDGFL